MTISKNLFFYLAGTIALFANRPFAQAQPEVNVSERIKLGDSDSKSSSEGSGGISTTQIILIVVVVVLVVLFCLWLACCTALRCYWCGSNTATNGEVYKEPKKKKKKSNAT